MSSRHAWVALGLLLLGGVWACVCDVALVWDGGYQLLFTLLDGKPFFYGTRFHSWFLWLPVTWLDQLHAPLPLLKLAFGAPFCLAPFAGATLSWWVTRRTHPHLFLWAIFGSAIATLPGQVFMINDSIWQMHFLWPVFFAVFVPATRTQVVVMALLAIFQTSHPIGIGLCGALAASAAAAAVVQPSRRPALLGWAGWFALLTAVSVWKLQRWPDSYAAQQAGLKHVLETFRWGVEGRPLVGLTAMWVVAVLLLDAPWAPRSERAGRRAWWALGALVVGAAAWRLKLEPSAAEVAGRIAVMVSCTALAAVGRSVLGARLQRLVVVLIVVTAVLWFIWGSQGWIWRAAINYRRWVAPMSLIFFLCALVELWRAHRAPDAALSAEHQQFRGRVVMALSGIFALVLGAQSTGWALQLRRLGEQVRAAPGPVLTPEDVAWAAHTPLDHWGVYTQVMLEQGQTPHVLYLTPEDLASARGEPPVIAVSSFYRIRPHASSTGWFDWAPVLARLRASPPAE